MAKVTLTPVPHSVFNEFDNQGTLLGLSRLEEEKNPAYKQRLLDVFVNRADSTYRGLVNGITRELGLSIQEVIQIDNLLDSNDDTVLTMPAVVFEETKCTLYSNLPENAILDTIDRFDEDDNAWTLQQLVDRINLSPYFTATLLNGAIGNQRSMTIFNQSTIQFQLNEDISEQGSRIKLLHKNILPGTFSIISDNLIRKLDTEAELSESGDYYIDLVNGIIVTISVPEPGSFVRYQFRNDTFKIQNSPVILHNLQSDDFKTKMFVQTENEDGDLENGQPTPLGANLVNELLSVFPTNWGK